MLAAMDERSIVLAALAPAKGAGHTPVQVQKLLFLIDRQIPELVAGPHFRFTPYDYGPFDARVYGTLSELSRAGLATVTGQGSQRTYALTPDGQRAGEAVLARMAPKASGFVERASEFVRRLSFAELVAAIYKAFPEMRANSVFRG